MSPATDLLFLCAVLAIAWLVFRLRGRWREHAIGRMSAKTVIVVLACTGLGIALIAIYENLQQRPKPVAMYADITLGDTQQAVRYSRGNPSLVQVDTWSYDLASGPKLIVRFDSLTRAVASVECYARAQTHCPPLLGISGGETEEELLERLGQPLTATLSSGSSVVKTVTFANSNARFLLIKRRVIGLVIRP